MYIEQYAPVVLSTLNRYEHFKACLESLEMCTGAMYTDVYVGLDYPPSDRYVDGWVKISEYLQDKQKSHRFNNLIIRKRQYNYGLKGEQGNINQLLKEVIECGKYDRYILSEDDNIFSPNFLEYMNKGLELYKNDKRVCSICGYKNSFKCMYDDNNHFAQHSLHQAWGYGTWIDRYFEFRNTLTPRYFKRVLYSPKKLYNCFRYWPHWTAFVYTGAKSTDCFLPLHDINMGFYLITQNKVVICPTISKVRNMGFDDLANTTSLSHENLKGRAFYEKNLYIDTEKTFEYIGDPYRYESENSYNIAQWDGKWENPSIRKVLDAYIRICVFRVLNLFGVF